MTPLDPSIRLCYTSHYVLMVYLFYIHYKHV